MASPSIQVTGLKEFRRDLKRLDPALDKELRGDLTQATKKVAVTADQLAPRSDAPLRPGDKHIADTIRPYISGTRLSVGSPNPGAGVLNFGGTIRPRGVPITFKPRNFVERAIDQHIGELVNDIANGIERAAHETGWH